MQELICGDSYEVLKRLNENSIDATICDPPYLLNFMGKEFDKEKGNPADDVNFWKLVLKVMKPGAYLLAAGIGRTHHRLMTAIENAGFEIRDCVYHCFGSGFPKSANIEKQLIKKGYLMEAETYKGYGTALKPAIEIWTLARKPLSEKTVAENCLKWGVGGLAIDNCRVGYISEKDKAEGQSARLSERHGHNQVQVSGDRSQRSHITGRFPANLILSWNEDEYELREDISKSDSARLMGWLNEA